jgi:uncharacterized protein (TIGR04255 family)
MRNRYTKPPLIEAICEFQFKAEGWDWTVPGLLYQQISETFSIKREQMALRVQQSDKGETKPAMTRLLQFVRQDERASVDVGENILAVHHMAPYPGWHQFKPMIASVFERYLAVAHPAGLARVGLRYVNRLRFPDDVVDLASRVNFWPSIPQGLPREMNAMFARVELIYGPDNGLLLLTLGSAADGGFVLDLDFITRTADQLRLEETLGWVETAHTRVEEAFEASLKDSVRSTFGEMVPAEEAS